AELPSLRQFQGKLGTSPQVLADALDLRSRLDREMTRLYAYASMLADQDTRVAVHQGMQQEMLQLGAEFGAQSAFFEPEILKMGTEAVDRALRAEPGLQIHAFYLRDILRRAQHTLSEAEEKLLASAMPLASAP